MKLFRNARKLMISDHKTTVYLKYAIGEIVLVVIGILIALQINNWNIDRLEKKNEQYILRDLKVEFQENLTDSERVLKGNLGIFNAVNQIQEMTRTQNYNETQLDSLMYFVFDWFDYTPKPGASNNLINSGQLNLIRNTELRNLLTIWSGVEAELQDDETLAVNYSQDIIIPFLSEHYPIRNLEKYDQVVEFYNPEQNKVFEESYYNRVPYDAEALLNNSVFQSHISAKKMYARHNVSECNNVVKTCNSILNLIEISLEKNN